MAANVKNPRWYHYLAIFPLFAIIRIWQASLRLVPQKGSKRYMISPDRMVGIAWHDSIFFLPMAKRAFRKKFPMAGLVSASRDGSYLCAFFKFCGIGTVRGSSRKRAATSAIGLIDTIRKGSDVFITPDGPLGPAHKAKNGFLTVANSGGIDIRSLPARAVTVHGKEKIPAVFCATPPHLSAGETEYSDISKIKLDTGLGEKAAEIVSVGDYVTFSAEPAELTGDTVTGRSFDDRAGAACLIELASRLSGRGKSFHAGFSGRGALLVPLSPAGDFCFSVLFYFPSHHEL